MSEVTSSIEEPIVRVRPRNMNNQQSRSTPPRGMVWVAILAGMVALGACADTATELNGMASELPVQGISTDAPPPREAVTDLYSVPLAAFKVQVPQDTQLAEGDEAELLGLPLGKAENNTDASPTPPFSNLWFNAGQSLGSAANSLTGWLNNRLVPQTTTTTTTTKPPELIVRVQNQKAKKKPLISIEAAEESRRKSQANRIGAAAFDRDDDDFDDDEEDDEEEGEYDDVEEEQVDEEDSNTNRYSNSNDDEEGDESVYEDEEEEEEEPVKPTKKRRGNKKQQTRRRRPTNTRRGYDYEEEDDGEYEDDDDYDYDVPNPNSGRQQQQQSLFNRFRQLAKIPYSSGNKQKNGGMQSQMPGYRPVRIVQNGQVLQLIQDRPSNQQQQVKRRRRPAASGETSYQLIPIQNNQVSNAGQKKKRKNVNRPDQDSQFVIPIPQSSQNKQQKRPSQFISIPWSQLGISNPQKDGQQAAPIIVNIPQYALQQNSNRRRRPSQQPSQATPQRKRLPLNNGPVISLLSEQNVRDIFRVPEIPPSRTPQRPLAQSDNATTNKPATSPQPEAETENDDDENQAQQEPYITVGEDDTEDEALPRHAMPKRFLHFGGMKPYADVLNKGRIYFKSGRLMRMDSDESPESEIISVDPQHTVHTTAESLSETKAQPIISAEDISAIGSPLSR